MKTYALAVIGAGSGGLVAARIAAKLGTSVALIEKQADLGGECLHAGCVPSKALIAAANYAASPKRSKQFGVILKSKVDFQAVRQHIQNSIQTIQDHNENDEFYQALGVDVYHGVAQFTSRNTITVNGETIKAKRFIISTGSSALVPKIRGLSSVPHSTNETIFTIAELPKRLLVIGGGPIGCELAQAFHKLGSQVTVLQHGDRLLPREEPSVSEMLLEEFTRSGIRVLLSTETKSFTMTDGSVITKTSRTGEDAQIIVDHVLIAAGRIANTDLNLEAAGIQTNQRGIVINQKLQTTNKKVYAIGDCAGGYQFTHYAAEQAGLAVRNTLFPFAAKQKDKAVPWITFTEPEIGRLGAIEDDLIANSIPYNLNVQDYAGIDKAVVQGHSGSVRILTDPSNNKILGATVVGESAGELLNQIAMVYAQNRPFTDLGTGIRAYPNYSFGLKQLASNALIDKAASSLVIQLLRRR